MRNISRNAHIIPRPRLLEKLQNAAERRLTVISAPAGYGKTVLASQFADQCKVTVAWQSLEERDRDPTNLFWSSCRALSHAVPEANESPNPAEYASSELASFTADLIRNIGQDLIYILDDIQYIEGSSGSELWLRSLLHLLPTNCHMVLIGRSVPELPLVEMLARQEVISIGQDDLRLNTQEISDLADDVLGTSHDS